MADAPRSARPDLTDLPPTVEAFELMRRMESAARGFGHSGSAQEEPARLGQEVRLGPAPCEVSSWSVAQPGAAARIMLETTGLFGPEGPMPLHLSRRILERLSERWFSGDDRAEPGADRSFLEFCNLLQHRMMALYYRAFADAQPAVSADHRDAGRFASMLAAIAGIGLPGTAPSLDDPELALRHATSLAGNARSPETLADLLADLLGAKVEIVEFAPHWQAIPPHLATRLGAAHAGLGTGAVIGPRLYQPQSRVEIRVGPLDLPQYRDLMRDGPARAALVRLLAFVMGEALGFDLRLVLAAEAVPAPELGRGVELGRLGWLAASGSRDRSDLALPLDQRRAA